MKTLKKISSLFYAIWLVLVCLVIFIFYLIPWAIATHKERQQMKLRDE